MKEKNEKAIAEYKKLESLLSERSRLRGEYLDAIQKLDREIMMQRIQTSHAIRGADTSN